MTLARHPTAPSCLNIANHLRSVFPPPPCRAACRCLAVAWEEEDNPRHDTQRKKNGAANFCRLMMKKAGKRKKKAVNRRIAGCGKDREGCVCFFIVWGAELDVEGEIWNPFSLACWLIELDGIECIGGERSGLVVYVLDSVQCKAFPPFSYMYSFAPVSFRFVFLFCFVLLFSPSVILFERFFIDKILIVFM